jgi:hypothetical protein
MVRKEFGEFSIKFFLKFGDIKTKISSIWKKVIWQNFTRKKMLNIMRAKDHWIINIFPNSWILQSISPLKYGITGFGLCNLKHFAYIHFISFFFVSSSQKHPFEDLLRWFPNCVSNDKSTYQTFDRESTKTNYKWKFKIQVNSHNLKLRFHFWTQ